MRERKETLIEILSAEGLLNQEQIELLKNEPVTDEELQKVPEIPRGQDIRDGTENNLAKSDTPRGLSLPPLRANIR